MDKNELAGKMLKWAEASKALAALEKEITDAVLKIAETQKVGNVVAHYSKGRATYDYQGSAVRAPADVIARYTETPEPTPKTDWRGVCKELGIQAAISSMTQPSVKLEIKE